MLLLVTIGSEFVSNCRSQGQCYKIRVFDNRAKLGRGDPRARRTLAGNPTAVVGGRTRPRTVGTRNGVNVLNQRRRVSDVPNQPQQVRNAPHQTERGQGDQNQVRGDPLAKMLRLIEQNCEAHNAADALRTKVMTNVAAMPLAVVSLLDFLSLNQFELIYLS